MASFNAHIIHKTEGFHGTIFDAGFFDGQINYKSISGSLTALIYGRVVQKISKNNIIHIKLYNNYYYI